MELYCQFASVETEERNRIFLVEAEFPYLHKIGDIYILNTEEMSFIPDYGNRMQSVSYILTL